MPRVTVTTFEREPPSGDASMRRVADLPAVRRFLARIERAVGRGVTGRDLQPPWQRDRSIGMPAIPGATPVGNPRLGSPREPTFWSLEIDWTWKQRLVAEATVTLSRSTPWSVFAYWPETAATLARFTVRG